MPRSPLSRLSLLRVVSLHLAATLAAGLGGPLSPDADVPRTAWTTTTTTATTTGPSIPAAPTRHAWAWPLPGRHVVARAFLAPPHEYGPGHRGVDLRADLPLTTEPADITVFAPADGIVAYAGRVADRPLLTIDHGSELVSTLEPVDATVAPGQLVRRGDPIGTLSGGGHAAAGALHLGARIAGEYVNPLRFLGGLERARLMPMG